MNGIHQTKQGIWVLDEDTHISRWVEQHGRLACDGQSLPEILKLIRPGDIVVDVGAFIGDHTQSYLERVGNGGHVYAFEPNPPAFECLRRNCPEAECFNEALGFFEDPDRIIQVGMRSIVHHPNAGASFLVSPAEAGGTTNVRLQQLDRHNLGPIDLIKIDVEGYEPDVLMGAQQTILFYRPTLVIEINHQALARRQIDATAIYAMLKAWDYTYHPLTEEMDFDDPQLDIVAVPNDQSLARRVSDSD